jgi:hypothetical protein
LIPQILISKGVLSVNDYPNCKIVDIEKEIASEDDFPNESNQEDEVTYDDQGQIHIIHKSLNFFHDESEESVRYNVLYSSFSTNTKVYDMIIDNGACTNVVFSDMVSKSQLKIKAHLYAYKLRWLEKKHRQKVTNSEQLCNYYGCMYCLIVNENMMGKLSMHALTILIFLLKLV